MGAKPDGAEAVSAAAVKDLAVAGRCVTSGQVAITSRHSGSQCRGSAGRDRISPVPFRSGQYLPDPGREVFQLACGPRLLLEEFGQLCLPDWQQPLTQPTAAMPAASSSSRVSVSVRSCWSPLPSNRLKPVRALRQASVAAAASSADPPARAKVVAHSASMTIPPASPLSILPGARWIAGLAGTGIPARRRASFSDALAPAVTGAVTVFYQRLRAPVVMVSARLSAYHAAPAYRTGASSQAGAGSGAIR